MIVADAVLRSVSAPRSSEIDITPVTPMPAPIDIGDNLTHRSFADDRDAVIARAAAEGVTPLVLTGTSERGSREALAL